MPKVLALVGGQVQEVEAANGVPVFIEGDEVFLIPKNKQALFSDEIDMALGAEVEFEENSILVEVS